MSQFTIIAEAIETELRAEGLFEQADAPALVAAKASYPNGMIENFDEAEVRAYLEKHHFQGERLERAMKWIARTGQFWVWSQLSACGRFWADDWKKVLRQNPQEQPDSKTGQ